MITRLTGYRVDEPGYVARGRFAAGQPEDSMVGTDLTKEAQIKADAAVDVTDKEVTAQTAPDPLRMRDTSHERDGRGA
jgi:hypothetical protein